jgi:predicted 3-demethylubiquinone-9 3-methyltransferase (glyoxalase superfamily)/uncharacterized protein YndB with AHSA1/START domain
MPSNATSTKGADLMTFSGDTVLQDEDGRSVLRFERMLNHPIERVWAALTELDGLRSWHPSPFELERRIGGRVDYLPPVGDAFGDGQVTAYEPPRLLAYSWGEDHLRWELTPYDDSGTRLVLTHTFDDELKAARDAAGWHLCLDALVALLSGHNDPTPTGESAIPAGWIELNRSYEQRFGIAPEDATPPPNHLAASDAAVPLLMFTGDAEEAMRFYVSVFFPARIEQIERYGAGEGIEGTVKHATLRLGDRTVRCIDSPIEHPFTFTPAISIAVQAKSADAVDGMFTCLSDGGAVLMPLDRYPFSERFAWVTDRFGVSWQLTFVGAEDHQR